MARQIVEDPGLVGYDNDLAGWAMGQVAALREREVLALDWEHLAEEIEGLAGSERDRLEAALRIVILHLLKWDHQPGRRSRSWANSIWEHRRRAEKRLRVSPSLRSSLSETINEAYAGAVNGAAAQMDVRTRTLPVECPYSIDEIMTRPIEWDGEVA